MSFAQLTSSLCLYTNQSQRAEEQRTEIASLEEKLAAVSTKAKVTAPAPSQDLAALQRENKLIASAWHDLSSRLQSNTTMLGRRRESPKSFLGQQRAIVTPTIAVGQVSEMDFIDGESC